MRAQLESEFGTQQVRKYPLQLLPLRGSLVLVNTDLNEYAVFNTTEMGVGEQSIFEAPFFAQIYQKKLYSSQELEQSQEFKEEQPSQLLFATQKGTVISSFMIVAESLFDDTEITLYEVITVPPNSSDPIPYRWPM